MSKKMRNPMALPGPGPFDKTELQKAVDILFPNGPFTKDAADFVDVATKILALVGSRAGTTAIEEHRKKYVINLLVSACLACIVQQHANFESIERQRNEIKKTRARIARTAKAKNSKDIDPLIRRHAIV